MHKRSKRADQRSALISIYLLTYLYGGGSISTFASRSLSLLHAIQV